MIDKDILSRLKELSTVDLIDLENSIKGILNDREVSQDEIFIAVRFLCQKKGGPIRYTDLTLYLEKRGLRRDAIANRIVKMWMKNASISQGGCPIGEHETPENPIYPIVEGIKYIHICYINCDIESRIR